MCSMERKKVLILQFNMELGGAESSLLGLLDAFDYSQCDVDLFLYAHEGGLLPLVNPQVRLLPVNTSYLALTKSISQNFKSGKLGIAAARSFAKLRSRFAKGPLRLGHNYKQYFHKLCMPFLPQIRGEYDLAISFNDPHFIIGKKVNAKVKMAWFHTNASRVAFCDTIEKEMWSLSDYVVNVSDDCKKAFDEKHPYLKNQSIVMENILSKSLICKRSEAFTVFEEMPLDGSRKLLTIGRFSYAKRMDEIPAICKRVRELGCNVKWYLIGFGSDEELIRQKIVEEKMQDFVVILGKKENPYPYIKACDLYVQPSRYEGKSVAVREAQILQKPVVITNYATAGSQLRDGFDGVIVPMDVEGCARGIAAVLKDKTLLQSLTENIKKGDYTNAGEIEKLYDLMK